MSADDLGQLLIIELLPNEKDLGKTSAEILRTLEERYGAPQSAEDGEEKNYHSNWKN